MKQLGTMSDMGWHCDIKTPVFFKAVTHFIKMFAFFDGRFHPVIINPIGIGVLQNRTIKAPIEVLKHLIQYELRRATAHYYWPQIQFCVWALLQASIILEKWDAQA